MPVSKSEGWLPVLNYEGLYEVSNLGRVRPAKPRYKDVPILKTRICRGYERVTIYKNGKRKDFQVHRLVADAFIPNPDNKPQVNHIDGNKLNNVVENLEWVTRSENQLHAKRTGLDPMIRNNPIQSKPVDMYSTDGVFLKTYASATEAERKTGINQGCISRCCAGKRGYKSAGGYVWKFNSGGADR